MQILVFNPRSAVKFAERMRDERKAIQSELESGAVQTMERYNRLIGRLQTIDEIPQWVIDATADADKEARR